MDTFSSLNIATALILLVHNDSKSKNGAKFVMIQVLTDASFFQYTECAKILYFKTWCCN